MTTEIKDSLKQNLMELQKLAREMLGFLDNMDSEAVENNLDTIDSTLDDLWETLMDLQKETYIINNLMLREVIMIMM